MASEIRTNSITSRAGLSTISLTSTGPIFAGIATFTGSIGIAGTLTYEDVTNIDSVGIITARSGIRVGANGTKRETVHLDAGDSGVNYLRFTNTGTGNGVADGFNVGINADENALLWNFENKDTIFATNNLERLRIQSNGIVKVESNDSSGLSAHLVVNNSESNSGLSIMGSGSSFSSGGWAAVTDAGIIRSSANSSNGLVMQAASGDMRFYVGGNPPAERLRIDSSGNVGVGTNVASDTTGNCRAFKIARPENGQVRLILQNAATGFGNGAGFQQGIDGANVFIENRTSGGYIDFANIDSGGTYASRMRIGSTGIIDAPTQAGFYARLANNKNDKTGNGDYYTVEWDTDSGSICYDQHNTFSTSTGLYQIPTGGDGVYIFTASVCLSTDVYGRQGEAWFLTNTGLRVFFDRKYFPSTTGTITGFYGSCLLKLTAGQTVGVQIFINGGSKNVDVFGAGAGDHISWFSGRKIA